MTHDSKPTIEAIELARKIFHAGKNHGIRKEVIGITEAARQIDELVQYRLQLNRQQTQPFTEDQLELIGKAIEAFLVADTIIIDPDNNPREEMTITLRNNAQGIRYYLGLEPNKPDYITNKE